MRHLDAFEQWLDTVIEMRQELHHVHETIQRIRELPEGPTLSADEQRLLDTLAQLGTGTNLIRIRQALSDLSDDAFWTVVRTAWERQIIEIDLKAQERPLTHA